MTALVRAKKSFWADTELVGLAGPLLARSPGGLVMKSTLTQLAGGALSLLVPAWLLVAPVSAQQQQQQQSQPRGESRGGGEGRATPHSGQGPSGGGGATTQSSGGGQSSSGG